MADTYRQLLDGKPHPASGMRPWVKRGVFGLAAVSIASWVLSRKGTTTGEKVSTPRARAEPPENT
jgi:hypothetical protein